MWIEALRIEGGVLDGFSQKFGPKLNVLIGGRGTGKSSVVELIRFCLGSTSYTDAGQQEAMEHALGVLGDGQVTVTVNTGKERFDITRTAQNAELDDPDILAPFVFSQSEIENLGLQAHSRLRLIDDFLPAERRLGAKDAANASKIRSATTEIRSLLAEIDDISEKTAELPKLLTRLESLKAQSATQSKVHKEIQAFRKGLADITPLVASARVKSEAIARSAEKYGTWSSTLEDILDRKPSMETWPVQAGGPDELADLRKREATALLKIRTALEEYLSIAAELERRRSTAGTQRAGLENRARDIRQKIEEKQKGASAIDKQISDLTQQISVLSSLVDLQKERATRVAHLTEQRTKLLEQQDEIRQQRTKSRDQIAGRITKDLAPAVRASVTPNSQRSEYVSALSAALRGSGLRYKELAEHIAETFSPQEIAALAETRDSNTVSEHLEISAERALRLCDSLRDQGGAALFTTLVEDDIQIELMDGADYKEIDVLSMGQRCTAILPIILRHMERTIILDQPEDHLDNAFVVGTLVKSILSRSQTAQSIIATHNPNIPVLGNANLVIHMDSDGSRCFVRSSGVLTSPAIVDAITTIMEGGREAFERRSTFYAKNLPNVAKS